MFNEISAKQLLAYNCWFMPDFKDFRIVVLHGAIRTGKTMFGSFGLFNKWEQQILNTSFDSEVKGWNKYAVIAPTSDSAFDNVVDDIMQYADKKRGYRRVYSFRDMTLERCQFHNQKHNTVYFRNNSKMWAVKYVGANNKTALTRIQGRTWRGIMIDEAGLISIDIIQNAYQRLLTFQDSVMLMTSNPEGNDTHPFYETYIRGGYHKGILVVNFQMTDNPIFEASYIEYLQKIHTPTVFQRKVLGKWVRDTGAIYKKFDPRKHVHELYKHAKANDYLELSIGVDYGEVDATSFTLEGMKFRYSGLDILRNYYHKNSDGDEKDINEYLSDFIKWVQEIDAHMNISGSSKVVFVEVESATHGLTFSKLLKTRLMQMGMYWVRVKSVNKGTKTDISTSAIRERIDIMNMMLGADYIRFDVETKETQRAISNCVWKKDTEERLDDKSVDINSMDSMEYGYLRWIKYIHKIIHVHERADR